MQNAITEDVFGSLHLKIIKHIVEELPTSLRFHNIRFAYRVAQSIDSIVKLIHITEKEESEIKLAGWFLLSGFNSIYDNFEFHSTKFAEELLLKNDVDENCIQRIISILEHSLHPQEEDPLGSFIIHDAYWSFLAADDFGNLVEKLYEESLLHSYTKGRRSWYISKVEEWSNKNFKTPIGQDLWAETKKSNLLVLESKIQAMPSEDGSRLLNVRESELQDLIGKFKKSKKKIGRGIQTMFRLTSRNHFTLNQMVDRKANIMITVNTILLSLIVGGFIGNFEDQFTLKHIPFLILMVTTLLSILFAVFSIRPEVTHGEFTEEEIRNKMGNLLFYGNFHKMNLRDYEWGLLQVMNDPDYLYLSMVRDIYYLGKVLAQKHKTLRLSLGIFMIGLVLAVITFLSVGFA